MQTNLQCWWFFVAVVCLLTLSSLGLAEEFDPDIIDKLIQSKQELVPGSPTYEAWRTPSDNYFEVYLFNWTNAAKFPGEKPHLEELGPYRFRQHREHVNVTWNQTQHILGHYTFKRWVFDDTSSGSLDDNVTTVDFLTAAVAGLGRPNQSTFIKISYAVLLRQMGHGIYTTKTVRQLLFEGYEDIVLGALKILEAKSDKEDLPNKFGWFYQKNNSMDSDGYLEVTTGEDGSLPGQIVRWMHEDHNKFYEGPCSKLTGSMGDFLPRNLTEESELKVFIPDLCRSVKMPYIYSGEYKGIQYHKYGIAPSSFDKASNNNCFCNGECEWGGVMNVSTCRFNRPAYISLPHFLHGDPRLGEQLLGLNPDPEKHSFYYAVEPRSGVPLDVAYRYQINVYIEDDDSLYKSVPKMLFPVFWVQERRSADQAALERLLPKRTEVGTSP